MRPQALLVPIVLAATLSAMPPVSARSTDARLAALAPAVRKNLEQAIIPFWYPQSIDREHGGYILAASIRSGQPTGRPAKMIVSQARMVWTFARLARSGYKPSEMLPAATQGFRFLADHMWDRELGGFYWEVDATGETVTDPEKYMYGESFALYALSEYYRAPAAIRRRWISRPARSISSCSTDRDEQFGGYYEYFARATGPAPAVPHPSHIGGPVGAKLMNTHLHLLEAFAEYYRASRSARCARSAARADRDREQLRRPQAAHGVHGSIHARLDADSRRPIRARRRTDTTSRTSGCSPTRSRRWESPNHLYLDLYKSLYAYSRRYGFDEAKGGIFYSGAFRKKPTSSKRCGGSRPKRSSAR